MNKLYVVCFALLYACKPIELHQSKSVSFAPFLNIGVYEYNDHNLNLEPLFLCAADYCDQIEVSTPYKTGQAFQKIGWDAQTLRGFLQDESFTPYVGEDEFHLILFFFQSQGVDYMRVVNGFTQTVSTKAQKPQSKIQLQTILQQQQLVHIDSTPSLGDVYIDGRKTGEVPLWLSLPRGTFELSCKLPGQQSKPRSITAPGKLSQTCTFH